MLLIAAPVFAQRFTAAIRGTVTDQTAGAIPGASVTLTNENTGLTRTAPTNAEGNYSFADLPVGSYKVEVALAGFKTAVRSKVVINVADVRAVNFVLETGAITESVSVVADSASIKTVGAEIAGLVTGEQARELPLNGRNFLQLTLLQPGVTANQDLNTVNKGLAGGSDISVSGGSTTSNLWLIDGADNVDHGSNRTIMVYPSIDAIEEFKIQRNNYGAEFGQAGGAQVNLVTRGGTNLFHGSAYYYIRRDSLNANNYFLEEAGQPKPELKWDDWGATFGGPIIKDKLHFFLSYEKNKDTKTSVRSGFVPTAEERAGNFSGSRLAGCTPQIPNDPLTGQPFPGNIIPANRISPAGAAFANLYQLPNNNPSSGCNNYVEAVPAPVEWDQINARLDWNLSNSTRVMVRYTQDSWVAANTILWGDSNTSTVGSDWDQPGKSLVAQLNQNIGSTMTNTLTFSYSANKITATRTGNAGQVDTINSLLPTAYPASGKQAGGDAQPLFWGAGGYGDLWNQAPWVNNQDLYVLKDDFSAVFGKHFVKVGAFYSTNAKNEWVNNSSQESVGFGGSSGFMTPSRLPGRPQLGQRHRGPAARGHGLRHGRARHEPERPAALARHRVLRGRLLQDRPPLDGGLRHALQPHAAAVHGGRPHGELRPVVGQPRPRRLLVQRPRVPAGNEPVHGSGHSGRKRRAEPTAHADQVPLVRPASRRRLGRERGRQDGHPRRHRPLLPA